MLLWVHAPGCLACVPCTLRRSELCIAIPPAHVSSCIPQHIRINALPGDRAQSFEPPLWNKALLLHPGMAAKHTCAPSMGIHTTAAYTLTTLPCRQGPALQSRNCHQHHRQITSRPAGMNKASQKQYDFGSSLKANQRKAEQKMQRATRHQ